MGGLLITGEELVTYHNGFESKAGPLMDAWDVWGGGVDDCVWNRNRDMTMDYGDGDGDGYRY